jgi:hypothetical protein
MEKQAKRTPRNELDALITWYEKFKPDAGRRIPVSVTPKGLAKILDIDTRDVKPLPEYVYRGRTIVATKI